MKLTVAAAAVGVLTFSASASAASLTPSPRKACYRDRETLNLLGRGFTPEGSVTVSRDGTLLGELDNDPLGRFNGQLAVRQLSDQSRRTYTAKDATNPALEASTRLLVSATEVNVGPTGGLPGRRLRIGARGFTTGTTLYAHVVRGRSVRSRRVGRLRSPCGKLLAYKRLFGENAAAGRYEVQFDTIRSYRPRTPVQDAFDVTIRRVVERSPSPAAQSSTSGCRTRTCSASMRWTARRSSALAIRKRPSSSL